MCPTYRPALPRDAIYYETPYFITGAVRYSRRNTRRTIQEQHFSDYMAIMRAFIWNICGPQPSKSHQRNSGNWWETEGPQTTKQSAQPLTFASAKTTKIPKPLSPSSACTTTSLKQLSFLFLQRLCVISSQFLLKASTGSTCQAARLAQAPKPLPTKTRTQIESIHLIAFLPSYTQKVSTQPTGSLLLHPQVDLNFCTHLCVTGWKEQEPKENPLEDTMCTCKAPWHAATHTEAMEHNGNCKTEVQSNKGGSCQRVQYLWDNTCTFL